MLGRHGARVSHGPQRGVIRSATPFLDYAHPSCVLGLDAGRVTLVSKWHYLALEDNASGVVGNQAKADTAQRRTPVCLARGANEIPPLPNPLKSLN